MLPDATLESFNNDKTKIETLFSSEAVGKGEIRKNDAIQHNDTKFVKTQHRRTCDERRSLLQIVIDTPNIYEVTVVSKSVTGK